MREIRDEQQRRSSVERLGGKFDLAKLLWAAELQAGIIAEHLLNNRLQMRYVSATGSFVTLNKTNEKWSVRTGQGELANRRPGIVSENRHNDG